ncbi:hypothetical protein IQ07DRAFT_171588 [Pyrenochaeta sp. DS3sAY3a]|nr:hypothetical protein IQ07DRAFT_171588 [Pyrenochaeta sp. DS3sAY3a]
MDRDRERDRDRGDRRDERYSNTYRPRSPGPRPRSPGPRPRSPRGDSYRVGRSPPRRSIAAADTYTPGGRSSRPRSRSPAFRRRSRSPRRDDNWRARPRSPPRRGYSPRRDDRRDDTYRGERARSPRRDGYHSYPRSPRPRERSPHRERDISPARSRGIRSPMRPSRYDEPRSRPTSPARRYSPARDTRDYRRRSPSLRRERADPHAVGAWRRRSPSPARPAFASNDASGRDSAATSRRSSPPPIHPSRAAFVEDRSAREPASAPRSPLREREFDRGRDHHRERERSPRRRDSPPSAPAPRAERDRDFAPPTGPASSYRNGDSNFPRAPPTGPSSRSYPSPAVSPPAGPAVAAQAPTFPRSSNPVLAAPTRPRGGGRGFGSYDAPRDFSGPAPRRGSWGGGPRGGGYYGGAAPGPRGSGSGPAPFAPSFRGSSNSTATTYPRTMRFRDHLADLPKEIPGGQKAPELYDRSKLLKTEEDIKRLREKIAKKEDEKRQNTKEWDTLAREAEVAQLRVDLAEGSLRALNGEGDVSGAF